MPSSERRILRIAVAMLAASAFASRAEAQERPQGFAVERFYPSAPGGGWFVMDDLAMHGGLGGVAAVTGGYALKPLRITDGAQHLSVVSDQAFVDVGLAVTYERFRFYLDLPSPLVIRGNSGDIRGYHLDAPSIDAGNSPDLVSDSRLGFDARLLGDARSPFRLGAGAQLIVPNGNRFDYDTDGTFRGMVRALFAGDAGVFTYAGQVGVHLRPLDDSPVPGSPRGSELLFGVAAGPRLPVTRDGGTVVVVGPEIYGQTALRSFPGANATGLEGLLTGRIEGTGHQGPQLRVKLGTGGGIYQDFGAPEWRVVVGVEVFQHAAER
jgi:hypothetical protein